MTGILLVGLLAAGLVAPPGVATPVEDRGPDHARPALRAPATDRWLAEDKLQHFAASFAATGMAYGAARAAMNPRLARITAASVGAALGVAKEIADYRGGGPFSLKDLLWDAAGVALGITLARSTR